MSKDITKNKAKPVFTRITLDPVSLQAVRKIQKSIPNYDVNDAVKMIIGVGIKNLDLGDVRLPDKEEQKAIKDFVANPELIGVEESEKFLKKLKKAVG